MARLVGDQLQQNQPQLAAVEHPSTAPAPAATAAHFAFDVPFHLERPERPMAPPMAAIRPLGMMVMMMSHDATPFLIVSRYIVSNRSQDGPRYIFG